MTLKSRLILRFVFMPLVSGSFLFLPAGSFRFWQGWVYFIITLAYISSAFGYFYRHDPQLIERRLRRGWKQETVREQKLIMKFITPIMLIAFLLPGFDYRFGWSHLPLWLTILSQAFVVGGYVTIFWALKSNSFAAGTIRVWPESDFHWAVYHRPPSHVFGRGPMVLVHAPGAGIVLCLTRFCPAHPANRFPAPQRGKGSAPRTAGLFGILSPHTLPARSVALVNDICSSYRHLPRVRR